MKSILLVTVVASAISFSKCNKEVGDIPPCINEKIAVIKASPKANPSGEVNEYLYNGKRVFLFTSPCCDQYNPLYDENCNYICSPSGGFTGAGDGKCKDFKTAATFIKQVWKDPR